MAKALRIVSCEAVEPGCHRRFKIVASKLDAKRR